MLPCRLALGLGFWVLVNFLILYFQKQMVLRWRLEVGWGWGECWHSVPLAHINDTALLKKRTCEYISYYATEMCLFTCTQLHTYFMRRYQQFLLNLHTYFMLRCQHFLLYRRTYFMLRYQHFFLYVHIYFILRYQHFLGTCAHTHFAMLQKLSLVLAHINLYICVLCYATQKKKSCIEHGTLFKLQWLTRSPLKPKK